MKTIEAILEFLAHLGLVVLLWLVVGAFIFKLIC